MNQQFRNINIEDVLFFDLEIVRKSKDLEVDSKEFFLYQKKIRNKETDELPDVKTTLEDYRKRAALKMGYNKIVCATVGRVIDGVVYLRSFTGEESEILKGLYDKFNSAKFLSGFNILGYDLGMSRVNSLRHPGISELIPDIFNDSLKKEWNLDKVLELMNAFRGSHYANCSLDEVCYHLGIPSPKDGIDGSQVSDVYYNEGIERIEKYCKGDVFAVINVFRKLQLKDVYETYVDMNEASGMAAKKDETKEIPLLERIYNSGTLGDNDKKVLESLIKKKKLTNKDKENIFIILRGVLVRNDFENNDQDSKATIERKEKEVRDFINSL